MSGNEFETVVVEDLPFLVPKKIIISENVREIIITQIKDSVKAFNALIREGVPPEDAEYILSNFYQFKVNE